MKKIVCLLIAAATLALPSVAVAREVETAGLVESQLIDRWTTTDGVRVRSAICTPRDRFTVHQHRIFGAEWNCIEVDNLSRTFWVHATVANSRAGGLRSVIQYRCAAAYSRYSCPSHR